jgi:pre-mRNA cleavage complex 2 protein Pcf11
MKQPRPHLISKLYDAFPNQCVTCGRRFENTAEGKQRKARHMDWHFKVKDPDMAKRGVHRSWYIGEREWIDYTEVDETAPEPNANGAGGSSGTAAAPKKEAKDKYVPVPTDPALVHNPCPICQEKFEPQWLVEANDFVWMDAVAVGGKIYHATCWEEYSKGGGGDQGRPATPDAVLGKRKAEVSPMSSGKKIRAF